MSETTDLSTYDNSWYSPGGKLKRLIWYFINLLVFQHSFFPVIGPKIALLRWFGAKVGKGVIIKPNVNVKYPWLLSIGDYTWIGEGVWIDNLGKVIIGKHCCISQGALILSGNHNYKKTTFDLIIQPIELEDGVWIGAKAIVTQGVRCKSHALLTVGSVASKNLEPYSINRGNPAEKIKNRVISK